MDDTTTPTPVRRELTDKELEAIAFLHDFFNEHHQIPTLQVMADKMGFASVSTSTSRLRSLEAKGYLEKNLCGNYRFTAARAVLMFQRQGLQ